LYVFAGYPTLAMERGNSWPSFDLLFFGRKWEYIPTSQKKFLVPKIGNDTGNTGYLNTQKN
jgi:hypothetical protein